MRVAVLGAGIAGLATAYFLKREAARRRQPLDLTLYEASGRPGGRIRTVDDAGYRIEWAANGIQGVDGVSARLLGDLGLKEEQVLARPDAARRYVAADGRLHLLPTSPGALLGFGALSARARMRVLAEPLFARRVSKEESVLEFAARHIGDEAARRLIGTAVRGIYAGDAAKLSLDATFPSMRDLERKHRSLLVAMARERRTQGRRTLWSLARGLGRLAEAFAASLGGTLRLDAPVLAIERFGEGARGALRLRLASGEWSDAEALVLAVPARAAAALLRPLDRDLARLISTIESAGLAVVALGFRPEAFRAAPDGYGFLVAPGEPLEILGALYESNLFPERAPEGRLLIRVMMGGSERPELLTKSDADLIGLAMKALDRTLGLKTGPERTWVVRQEEAIPQYAMGHRGLVGAIASGLDAHPGLFVAGNAYRGVSVGSILEDAERVAARLLA